MRNITPTRPFVVARDQIPVAHSEQGQAAQLRPFQGHELMAHIASSDAELSWLEARAGQQLAPRANARPTLLIVMRGRASLVGSTNRVVEQGDALTLPSEESFGFADVEEDLHVLQVCLRSPVSQKNEPETLTLERVLERNRARALQVLDSPFYLLLRNGLLDTTTKRAAACEAIRVFSDAFQTFLFTRQAMCRDEGYSKAFHGHLLEELGHNRLLEVAGNRRIFGDPILRATSSWFSHQMLTLDNAGKAIVNLVLETSGYHFHNLAKPVFSSADSSHYFELHAEADEDHMDLGVDLLGGLHPDVYRRLLDILEDSWNMMETVTTRFAELIEIEVSESSCAAQ